MSESQTLIQFVLEILGCSQKELAETLGVSQAQVSKWKKGEYMSEEMRERLRSMAEIGDLDAEFVRTAGSLDDAQLWVRLFKKLADDTLLATDSVHYNSLLQDDLGLLSTKTFDVLAAMGVHIPRPFPSELAAFLETPNETSSSIDSDLYDHPMTQLIGDIYDALDDVYEYFAAYVSEIVNGLDESEIGESGIVNIEPCLIDLAAAKLVEVDEKLAPTAKRRARGVKKEYERWLWELKCHAYRAQLPIRAELRDLLDDQLHELSAKAQRCSSDFESRIHPDIYINELITGARENRRLLEQILAMLGAGSGGGSLRAPRPSQRRVN